MSSPDQVRPETVGADTGDRWLKIYRRFLYPAYTWIMRAAAIWSPRVRGGIEGRINWEADLRQKLGGEKRGFRIHVHASSVGEFEQGVPVVEALQHVLPECDVTASFFSTSGYGQRKNYPFLAAASLLPYDRPDEVSTYLDALNPDVILIMRYDVWPEFVREARERGIPALLVCATLRARSSRLWPLSRSFFNFVHRDLQAIHTVSRQDKNAFDTLIPEVPVRVSGDTRFDRVAARAGSKSQQSTIQLVRRFAGDRNVVVAGSSWRDDEEIIRELQRQDDFFLLLAPHEPSTETLTRLLDLFPGSLLLSDVLEQGNALETPEEIHTIIVDSVGNLAELYESGDIAWVGGGFGAGVHSLLEPAAHGLGMISGPRVGRSTDAPGLEKAGSLIIIRSLAEAQSTVLPILRSRETLRTMGEAARSFVESNLGATDRIVAYLKERGIIPQPAPEPPVVRND